jgi:hypothetical protein
VLESSPHAEIIESPYTTMPTDDHRGLDDLPTIFAFLVVRSDGTRLDHDEASAVHRLLGRDISHLLDSGEDKLATRCFYLGQPVKVVRDGAHWLSALRFAIGAPTISQVVFDYTRGETWSDRIERELSDVSEALDKLAMILRSVDLRAAAAQLEPTPQRTG